MILLMVISFTSCVKRIDGPLDIEMSSYTSHEINLNYALYSSSGQVEYIDKVYYSLADSMIVKSVSSNDWSIAFNSVPNSDRKVIMNYALGKSCNGFTKNDTNWSALITENDYMNHSLKFSNHYDTFANLISNQGVDLHHVYYLNYNIYDTYKKFQVLSISSSSVTFRYANIDGSNEKTITVPINTSSNFTYFSFKSHQVVNIEPANKTSWDIEFTRYTTLVTEFNSTIMYTVTGAILNPYKNIQTKELEGVNLEDINSNQLKNYTYSSYLGNIGYNWKQFSSGSQDGFYSIPKKSYIIKANSESYGIQFTEYSKIVNGRLIKGFPTFLQRNF